MKSSVLLMAQLYKKYVKYHKCCQCFRTSFQRELSSTDWQPLIVAMTYSLIIIPLVLTLGSIVVTPVSAQSCHLRELDLCAATLLVFTQNPTGIATTENELSKQCGYLKEADLCLRNYTRRCATPLQRELISFVTEGSLRLLSEYCSRGSQLQRSYLKHAQCLNNVQRTQRICVKDLQAALEVISQVEWDKRIPAGCCSYRRFVHCTENLVESKCGKDAVEFMNLLLRMALSRLPDIICQGYGPDNTECKALLPEQGTKPKGSRSNSVLSRLFSAYTGL